MNRRIPCAKTVAALAAVAVALAFPAAASADAVADWSINAAATIAPRQPPWVAVISLAMVDAAVYDAVNAIDTTHRPYVSQPPANPWDSQDAAAATAAYRVLVALFPSQETTLAPLYATSLAGIPDGPAEAGGIAAGEAAAAAILAARANDGRGVPVPVTIGTAPGAWRPTPPAFVVEPAPWVAHVRPFLVPSVDMLATEGPPALTSGLYAKDLAEVARVGSATSTKRTADQTTAALFWHTDHPATMFGGLLRSLAASHGLETAEHARLQAMVWTAAADAAIGCWHEKYRWSFWRPVTAIREAATDGNPRTTADPAWTPLIVTPPMPDYPSGHSCISTAIMRTLAQFFGTDKVAFELRNGPMGLSRHFERFAQAVDEVLDARVWGGIHFRTADERGAVIGQRVARWLRWNHFEPIAR
jgi:hypothetical protein